MNTHQSLPIRVLHLTPHLGGGVGKALSKLVDEGRAGECRYIHEVLCFEAPEKSQFVDEVEKAGCKVGFLDSTSAFVEAVDAADIVQLEFWNHPTVPRVLCSESMPEMRLIVWCHTSGLHHPRIPPDLLRHADRIVFTSECSFQADEVRQCGPDAGDRFGCVSSGCGLSALPLSEPPKREDGLRVGYVGSLNFAKLHPDFVSFLAAVEDPTLRVRMIGDEANRGVLEMQCRVARRPNLLDFRGYTDDVGGELKQLDILFYLLNPRHYGTAENALLEAMAVGVVPIVLDNPAERQIVQDGVTGLIVRSPEELARAYDDLNRNRTVLRAMGRQAAAMARRQFTSTRMRSGMETHYDALMAKPKKAIPFGKIFGQNPVQWFLSFVRPPGPFVETGEVKFPERFSAYIHFERTKGSVFHFLDYFPESGIFERWAAEIESQKNVENGPSV